jgi:hypothetical protein
MVSRLGSPLPGNPFRSTRALSGRATRMKVWGRTPDAGAVGRDRIGGGVPTEGYWYSLHRSKDLSEVER